MLALDEGDDLLVYLGLGLGGAGQAGVAAEVLVCLLYTSTEGRSP